MEKQPFQFDSQGGFVFFNANLGFKISGLLLVLMGSVRTGVASKGDRVLIEGVGGRFVGMIRRIIRHQKGKYDVEKTVADEYIRIVVDDISNSKVEEYFRRLDYLDRSLSNSNKRELAGEVEDFVWQYLKFPVVVAKTESS